MIRRIVFLVEKIFSFEKAMVSGTESMVCAKQTIFMTTKAMVTAAQKMVSVALTMFQIMY